MIKRNITGMLLFCFLLLLDYRQNTYADSLTTRISVPCACLAPQTNIKDYIPEEEIVSDDWFPERSIPKEDKRIIDAWLKRYDKIVVKKIKEDYRIFRQTEYDFLPRKAKEEILSYERVILDLLEKIRRKVIAGKLKPWNRTPTSLGIVSGAYDFPTLAHELIWLAHLASDNTDEDFLVIGLTPDGEKSKMSNYRRRRMMVKLLIQPFEKVGLIRFSDLGENRQFPDFLGLLMKRYRKAYRWIQVMGSDALKRHGGDIGQKRMHMLRERYFSEEVSGASLQVGLHVFNRPNTSGNEFSLSKNEIDQFHSESHLPYILEPMRWKMASTDVRTGKSLVVYPTLLEYISWGVQISTNGNLAGQSQVGRGA
ncbi:MAG: hypothetical protein JW774_03870 [Candidatus Aureabacteria bacterium]|nr:hypothetical protein [Candidatus Auribacterota bacterium]